MLEAPTKPDELKANQKVRQYYSLCMDERNDQARNASGNLLPSDIVFIDFWFV